jgi:23S rRNA pseudouridine2457 synthase
MTQRYFAVYKPRDMVSQFVSPDQVRLLGDMPFSFPEGTHAIGRLDQDSEGLLLLTTNKKVTRLLFEGPVPHKRSYLVRVKGEVSAERLELLRAGVSFRIKGGVDYNTGPCDIQRIADPEASFYIANDMPAHLPHSWLLITLTEGKYHQVRKMVAAIHHPCRRLIRVSVEDLRLDDMQPGAVREMSESEFFSALHIDYPEAVTTT